MASPASPSPVSKAEGGPAGRPRGVIRYGRRMVFDFRHKTISGQWKSSGHRKGDTRDAAFAALEAKVGPLPSGKYMSRPRDGRTKNWDLFTRP
jgi:hypothetical protein